MSWIIKTARKKNVVFLVLVRGVGGEGQQPPVRVLGGGRGGNTQTITIREPWARTITTIGWLNNNSNNSGLGQQYNNVEDVSEQKLNTGAQS